MSRAKAGFASGRFVFANQLRGIAAVMVLLLHYTVVVRLMRPAVAWVVAAPPLPGPDPGYAIAMRDLPLDLAATGVGLFFLISGFVIPFSLERATTPGFLLGRAARIFPTFWAVLAIDYLVIHASGHYWGREPPFGWPSYALTGLLLTTILGHGNVDWVSWTLCVEVDFYLLAALCRPLLARFALGFPVGVALAAYLINVAARRGVIAPPPQLAAEATYIAFIMIGTMFHARLTGRLTRLRLLGGIVASVTLVMFCWLDGPVFGEFPGRSRSLLAALVVFGAAYVWRAHFRPNRILDAVASISYPLYLVHAVVGFTAVAFLVDALGIDPRVATVAALGLAVGLATLVHHAIEQPTIRLGQRLSRGRGGALPRTPPGAVPLDHPT